MKEVYSKYAKLLVNYCLSLEKGNQVLVRTSTLAEPFLEYLYKEILLVGAHPEFQLTFKHKQKVFFENASEHQINYVSDFYSRAIHHFDAVLTIDASHDINEIKHIETNLKQQHQAAMKNVKETFMTRSAAKDLKWCICVLPTPSQANEAGMTLEAYQDFVFNACYFE